MKENPTLWFGATSAAALVLLQQFLHMTDFFSTDTVLVSVTNMRYEEDIMCVIVLKQEVFLWQKEKKLEWKKSPKITRNLEGTVIQTENILSFVAQTNFDS